MSSILMVRGSFMECLNKSKDNKFLTASHVSENQSHQDTSLVIALQNDLKERLENDLHAKVVCLRLIHEPRANRPSYEGKNQSFFTADSVSFHHYTNDKGEIIRRVAVLYPMSKERQGELPRDQLIKKLLNKASDDETALEVVDLQHYEKEGKFLEGLGALNFSYDGNFVYMALSTRSDEEVLHDLCSHENLDIPEENRFVFSTEFPHNEKSPVAETVYHTSLVGWCGKGICAWGFKFMKFDSDELQEEFYQHIEQTYQKIINLNAKEIRAYAGNAFELAVPTENGDERRVLCISDTAMKALQNCNKTIIEEWYGHENIFIFYGDVIQRRCGVSIRGLVSNSITHGELIPAAGEKSVLEEANVSSREGEYVR